MTTASVIQTMPEPAADVQRRVFYCPSTTKADVTYLLAISESPLGALRITCNCPAGVHARPDRKPIPCKHARAVAQLLASRGDAEVVDGRYRLTLAPQTIWDEWDSGPVADVGLTDAERSFRDGFCAGWEALASQLVASAESRSRGWAQLEPEIRAALADAQRRTSSPVMAA